MRELEIIRYVEAIDEWMLKDKPTALRLVVGLVDTLTNSKSSDLDKWRTMERPLQESAPEVKPQPAQPVRVEYVYVRGNYPIPKKAEKKKRRNTIPCWHTIRADVIRRDEAKCRICTKDYYLHVHHIDHNRKNNKESNLVTLCESCHQAVHAEGYKPIDHPDVVPPWDKTDLKKIDSFNQDACW